MGAASQSAHKHGAHPHPWLFAAYLLGLALLPVPLGSNRPWSASLALAWFSVLSCTWLAMALLRRGSLTRTQPEIRVPLLLSAGWLLWLLTYFLPGSCAGRPGGEGLAALDVQMVCLAAAQPDAHRMVLLKSLLYVQIGLLTLLLVRTTRCAYLLVGTLIAAGAVWATLGTLAALVGTGFDWGWMRVGNPGRASGPFVNPNHFAGYLELLLGLGVGALLGLLQAQNGERQWRQWLRDWLQLLLSARALLRIALVIMVIALVTTQSRSGNVAFMLALLSGCALGAWCMPALRRKLLFLGASLLLVDLLIVSSWFGLDRLATRVGITAQSVVEAREQRSNLLLGADAERAEVALATLEIWRTAPLRGHGGGSFRSLFPAYRPDTVSDRLYDHAHNDYAQMLAEFGVLGTAFAVGVVGAALWLGIQAMRHRQRRSVRGLALGVWIGLVSIGIHSWTDFNLQIPANAALFTVLLALAWQCRHGFQTHEAHSKRDRSRRSERTHTAVAALALLVPLAGNSSAAATQESLADTCRAALAEPVAHLGVPPEPVLSASAARQQRDSSRAEEGPRAAAAHTAIALALRALALTARGNADEAAVIEGQLHDLLHDTVWRVQQAVKKEQRSDAALTLLLMYRLRMTDDPVTDLACPVLAAAYARHEGTDAVLSYEHALCVLSDQPALALRAIEDAATHGHVLAQETLARLCLQAQPADARCAAQWLCRAVAAGHGNAASQAAWLIQQHESNAVSLLRALYERGLQAHDAVSANNLGEMHENGSFGTVDLVEAERLYARAAEAGLPEAGLNLARIWLQRPGADAALRAEASARLRQLRTDRPEQVEQLVHEFRLKL